MNFRFELIAEAYDDPKYDSGFELSRFRNNRKEVRRCPICDYQNDFMGSTKELRNPPRCMNYLLEVILREDHNVRFLIETERIVRAVPVNQGGNVVEGRLGGLSYEQYSSDRKVWRENDILEVNIMDPHPLLKKRESQDVWRAFGSDTCIELAQGDSYGGPDWYFGPLPADMEGTRTVEVLVQKWQRCSRFHKHSRWYEGPRHEGSRQTEG